MNWTKNGGQVRVTGMQQEYVEKFQSLLRELFQFDAADLDFGIYRIMNHKREVIEKFITKDLPKAIAEELQRGALAEQTQAVKELKEVATQIQKTLGNDALDGDGNLTEAYHETPLGKKYLELKARAAGGQGREALETLIFNHLNTFFSRYYQDGDFISKRRYSKRQKYAIPYNGEEVHLHWANNDQYYVKTAEHFRDYSFSSHGVNVHFMLRAADVEQNNVKGEKRFFFPLAKEIEWDEKNARLVIPFEYRPLTEKEENATGKRNRQDAIIAQALEEIPKQIKKAAKALAALAAERNKNAEGEAVSFLEYHLRQYTRRNTADFFIHKDLAGFLSTELDFYLKNEVLNLDEVEAAGEGRSEGWFQIMRVVKAVGTQIIDFLAQIENFQKMLWEKRKFITETQYCITVGNIDESFYPEIAACEQQWAEWKELFHIDEEQTNLFTAGKNKRDRRIAFLKAHPTLVLDTKHFEQVFVDRLLERFDDLDGATDGLLVHGENWQALSLLIEKYRRQVQCVYIDPPYNTDATAILYKNDYRHSSWLSMMKDRLLRGEEFLVEGRPWAIAIDDYELSRLIEVVSSAFPQYDVNSVVVNHHPQGSGGHNISRTHEYMLLLTPTGCDIIRGEEKDGEFEARSFMLSGPSENKLRRGRPNSFYALLVKNRRIVGIEPPPPKDQAYPREVTPDGAKRVYPIGPSGREQVWARSYESACQLLREDKLLHTERGAMKFLVETKGRRKIPMSNWTDSRYNAGPHGTQLLRDILGNNPEQAFSYPKSIHLVRDAVEMMSHLDEDPVILDYFAGSGTTAHAAIHLEREDGGKRRFILVEMAGYFDTVLLSRIKKVIFSPDWKGGKPQRMATAEEAERSPRIVKYIRLESYEDALNNIEFDKDSGQTTLKFKDYLLKYMLRWETRKSETLLNVEKLASPFHYMLHLHRDGQTSKRPVDLPETFNYLLGLHVTNRRVVHDGERRYLVYRGGVDDRQVVVIWRETEGWTKEDLERDKKFVAQQKLADGADEVFINGDSFIPNAKALEPVFKAKMFAPLEA